MNTHFDYIPEELNDIILSYLDYNELLDLRSEVQQLDEIFKINYEKLFAIRYSEYYKNFKLVLHKDFNQYRNMWELFYLEFNFYGIDVNSITCNIKYSSLLLMDHPKFYKYVKIFSDKIHDATILSIIPYLVWGIAVDLQENVKRWSNNHEMMKINKFIIKKFFNGEVLTKEESKSWDMDLGLFVDNPPLLGFMMVEDCFVPIENIKNLLFSIRCYMDNMDKNNTIYLFMKFLYHEYKSMYQNYLLSRLI